MVKSLDKKWKELLFAASGFGPNFLMVLMGAYYSDAVNPAGLSGNVNGQTIVGNICLVVPALFSVLMILGKVFDGVIDIPFAAITDNLSTKWGRRRPPIAICFIPMVVSFAFCWWPIFGTDPSVQLANSIWFFFWALIFFASYTMCLIAFYGSLSNVCEDESQRLRVSSFKSFFDTISYCLVYALVPLIIQGIYNGTGMGIDKFVFMSLPLMGTMLIPLFLIKEGEKYGYPENNGQKTQEKIKLTESFKITFKNKIFRNWLVVNCCSFFGLQMFLVAMNAMILGGMGFNGAEMALVNTCAFAPVPIMLYLFRKVKEKKGIRFTYQTCLLTFALAILSFFFASTYVCGTNNKMIQYIIGCVGGVMGSWSIGAFFMMPYMIPAQISSVEEKLTNKNHSAMYFAAQAFTTSIVGAIASYGVYDILKNIFVTKSFSFTWAKATETASAIEVAGQNLNVGTGELFNFGVMIVPFIVAIMCIVGFIFAFKMPKEYTPECVAKELKKYDESLDISQITDEPETKKDKGEIVFVQVALSILSGFIFGFIWTAFLFKSIDKLTEKKRTLLYWILGCIIPFAGIFVLISQFKAVEGKLSAKYVVLSVITGLVLPILPCNIVSLAVLQSRVNKKLNSAQ